MISSQSKYVDMQTKIFRISTTVAALLIGILLVSMLTLVGSKTRGPLSDLLSFTGESVHKIEENLIIESRGQRRVNKLKWLTPYRNDPALIRNPKVFLFGAFDNNTREGFESIVSLEDSIKTTFPLIHIYTAWGSKPEEEFPTLQVKSILELGSIPIITWEPWLTDFDADKYPQLRKLEERDKGGLADIAHGKYDFYIGKWADNAKKINSQIFLRVGHEMNDPYRYPWGPQNNSAKDFVAAWKHIREVFKKQKANNIVWVWSPHPAYGYFDAFYPGDSMVDYVGVSALNYGTVASWSKWWTFKEIFGNYYKDFTHFKKPIMITEFGSLSAGGNRSKWFTNAMDSIPQKYPLVKSIVFFHYSDDKTTTQQTLNWYFKNDPPVTRAIAKEIQKFK
jgi:hypothetical protein